MKTIHVTKMTKCLNINLLIHFSFSITIGERSTITDVNILLKTCFQLRNVRYSKDIPFFSFFVITLYVLGQIFGPRHRFSIFLSLICNVFWKVSYTTGFGLESASGTSRFVRTSGGLNDQKPTISK